MQTRIYSIDWRDEFGLLEPYLNGKGGVVRVRYAGGQSAPSAFLGTLKSEYECKDDNSAWRSLRIDHEVYTVRYLSGIRDEFVRLMNLDLPAPDAVEGLPAEQSVFEDVEAESIDAAISNVTQNNYFGGENPALMSRNRDRWVKALCENLTEFLKADHMMVVVNHGMRHDQDEFWRYLWRGGLENLVESGLVLVHLVDVSDAVAGVHDLAPAAQLELDLPTALGHRARADAIEDLTSIIVETVPAIPVQRTRGEAHALVTAHVDDIPRLHRKYATCMMALQTEFG